MYIYPTMFEIGVDKTNNNSIWIQSQLNWLHYIRYHWRLYCQWLSRQCNQFYWDKNDLKQLYNHQNCLALYYEELRNERCKVVWWQATKISSSLNYEKY